MIENLDQLKKWIKGQNQQEYLEILKSNFNEKSKVSALLSLLQEEFVLSKWKYEDNENNEIIISGECSIKESLSVKFYFFESNKVLCADLEITKYNQEPSSLFNGITDVQFWDLMHCYYYNIEVDYFEHVILGEIKIKEFRKKVELHIPPYAGDYYLKLREIEKESISQEELNSFEGAGIFGSNDFNLDRLSLSQFEIAYSPSKKTVSLISLNLKYQAEWDFFGGKFKVEEIELFLKCYSAFTKEAVTQVELNGKIKIGNTSFDVGGLFPDAAIYATIAENSTIKVLDVAKFFEIALPEDFHSTEISRLGFLFNLKNKSFSFQMSVSEISLIDNLKLSHIYFDISKTESEIRGRLYAQLNIEETILSLGGDYNNGENYSLQGKLENLKLERFTNFLKNSIKNITIPEFFENLELHSIEASYGKNGGESEFRFDLDCSTTINDIVANLKITTAISQTVQFKGSLTLTKDSKQIEFEIDFDSNENDKIVVANYKSDNALSIVEIADFFDCDLSSFPSEFDLSLKEFGFAYNFTKKRLDLTIAEAQYGKIDFITYIGTAKKRNFYFEMLIDKAINLSNIPLIDKEIDYKLNVSKFIFKYLSAGTTAADLEIIGKTKQQDPIAHVGFSATLNIGEKAKEIHIPIKSDQSSPHKTEQSRIEANQSSVSKEVAGNPDVQAISNNDYSWINIQKNFGPVYFEKIGFKYDSGKINVSMFAELAANGLSISILGLSVNISLKDFNFEFDIQGLGISYTNPSLSLEGAFLKIQPHDPVVLGFVGGILIQTKAFGISAIGSYTKLKTYSSLFIFASVNAPFGGPPYFFVNGFAGGFGYNSKLRIPKHTEIYDFPFIQLMNNSDSDEKPNISEISSALVNSENDKKPWLEPSLGDMWLSAGIKFSTFNLVNSTALLLAQFGNKFLLSLIGTSEAQFPKKGSVKYANIELQFNTLFNLEEGVFSTQAALSPKSFLLHKDCHLSGEFAMFMWFDPNQNAGDFVITMGGYSPYFNPPIHYPQVPRLKINWAITQSVSITGEAYFALTPSAIMAGGRFDIKYTSSDVTAWFTAYTNVIINYSPFQFIAEVGISIGVIYETWWKTFQVELGATLELWGPDTGGIAEIHWCVFSFTVEFGAKKPTGKGKLGWSDFQELLPFKQDVVKITIIKGLSAESDDDNWIVRRDHFQFKITTPIPVTRISINNLQTKKGDDVSIRPMDLNGKQFVIDISVKKRGSDEKLNFINDCTIEEIRGNLSSALWGREMNQDLVKNQLIGLTITTQKPALSPSPLSMKLLPTIREFVNPLSLGSQDAHRDQVHSEKTGNDKEYWINIVQALSQLNYKESANGTLRYFEEQI